MKIGVAAPASLDLLSRHVKDGEELPHGYPFPPMTTLIEGYMQNGHTVALFTTDQNVAETRTFEGAQLSIHVVPARPRARERAMDLFGHERAGLLGAMKKDPCQVIHAHWTYEFALAAMDCESPCIVTAHDAPLRILRQYLTSYKQFAYRLSRTLMAYKVARRAQCITAVSEYVALHFRRVFRHPRAIDVIPNALPDYLFRMDRRRNHHQSKEFFFAASLTGWEGGKNGQTVLRAFPSVRKVMPEARLLMFGRGHGEGERAAAWAKRRGLHKGVTFAGTLPHRDLMNLLASRVDVFVHPALEESFSMAIAEAMALGLPVIGGLRSGAVPSTLEYGRAGLLVDVRSPQCIMQAMVQMAKNEPLRRDLGQEARKSAQRRFRVDSVVGAYESVLGRVA